MLRKIRERATRRRSLILIAGILLMICVLDRGTPGSCETEITGLAQLHGLTV